MGVLNIKDICGAPRVAAVAWGCEDLSEQLGSLTNRHASTNEYLDVFKHARITTLMAAKAHGVMAIDGAYTNISDTDGLAKETKEALAMGFDGKLSLAPKQINVIHDSFVPTLQEIESAR